MSEYNCPNCNEIMGAPDMDKICECPNCRTMMYRGAIDRYAKAQVRVAEAQVRIAQLEAENKQMLTFLYSEPSIARSWFTWCWSQMVDAKQNHASETEQE